MLYAALCLKFYPKPHWEESTFRHFLSYQISDRKQWHRWRHCLFCLHAQSQLQVDVIGDASVASR